MVYKKKNGGRSPYSAVQQQQPVPNYRMSDIANAENEPVFHPTSANQNTSTAVPVSLEDEPVIPSAKNDVEHDDDEQPLLS